MKVSKQLLLLLFLLTFSGVTVAFDNKGLLKSYDHFIGPTPKTGEQRSFELTAKMSELSIGKGKPTKVWAYNNQIPGPVLRVKRGDNLNIAFKNELPEATTIHWHGIRVPNEMDGVPNVTQKPIQPGEQFKYEFKALDSGTFWFHPHVRSHEQVERGLYGILIVESPEDPVYDQEWVWILDDWLLTPEGNIEDSFSVSDMNVEGRLGNLITINGMEQPNYEAKAGERIRIRVINTSNARNFQLDFKGMVSKIFAVDGNITGRPLPNESFEIAPGNRVDVDLTIPNDIAKTSNEHVFEVANLFFHREADETILPGPQTVAKIKVSGKVEQKKNFAIPTNDRVPVWKTAMDAPLFHTYNFDTKFNWGMLLGGGPSVHFVIDGNVYGEHEVKNLQYREFYRIRFTNATGLYHPIHIHGVFFKVLSRGGEKVNEPFFRDTALLDYDSSLEIGVIPVDLGKWLLHCHLLEHSALGMMTLIEVKK